MVKDLVQHLTHVPVLIHIRVHYVMELRPVHTWTRVTLVHAIQGQSARVQKDLESLIAVNSWMINLCQR